MNGSCNAGATLFIGCCSLQLLQLTMANGSSNSPETNERFCIGRNGIESDEDNAPQSWQDARYRRCGRGALRLVRGRFRGCQAIAYDCLGAGLSRRLARASRFAGGIYSRFEPSGASSDRGLCKTASRGQGSRTMDRSEGNATWLHGSPAATAG